MAEDTRSTRGHYGPVLALGLASATLAAVAGNKSWAHAEASESSSAGSGFSSTAALGAAAEQMPVAGALALVVLACWGVILVSRGRVRRAVAVLATLAAAGIVASVVIGFSSIPEALRADFLSVGIEQVDVERTGWFWAAALGALFTLATTAAAVRLMPAWPEMGTRYDAPGSASAPVASDPAAAPEEQTNLDLWKALDEGRDPTAGPPE